ANGVVPAGAIVSAPPAATQTRYTRMVPPPSFTVPNNESSQIVQTGHVQSTQSGQVQWNSTNNARQSATPAATPTRGWVVFENAGAAPAAFGSNPSATSQSPGMSIQLVPVPNSGSQR